ncbi:ABC transporter permease [Pedobacter frigoris]|uniref:FtsX-like permease family protein n=1 Tax=Pedobacter frigoris TaxID=2571272 RepID=A0A4U1CML2_9SPHI|nr:FtsX-like permease family protein [Pedobacter frigoris]TKC08694.1 FtsX-like permease family protein [Pedobacter frigoris]
MLKNYIKIAFKVMMRQKFFTAVSLFGISFTIMIFSILLGLFDFVYGNNAPAVHHDRMIYFEGMSTSKKPDYFSYLIADSSFYNEIRKLKQVQNVSLYRESTLSSFRKDRVVTFNTAYTDAEHWKIYDFTFLEGRPYNQKDVQEKQAYTVISESVKHYYFGDKPALGQYIGEHPKLKVIGVVKDGISIFKAGTEAASIWIASGIYVGYTDMQATILVRSKREIPVVKSALEGIAKRTAIYKSIGGKLTINADTIFEKLDFDEASIFLGGFLFFIMAIPALNMMGLNVGRISERSSEIGIRKAFGASSSALVGQFITENIIITFIGGILGILLTFAASDMLLEVIYYENPETAFAKGNFMLNWKTIGYSMTCILFFGFLSGIIPAWRMSRLHAIKALKGGSL